MATHDDPTPEQEIAWIAQERAKVAAYLAFQSCDHNGIGEWPAFHVYPYLAIWAIQSKRAPGKVGWWAISGDLPTDYMTGAGVDHPRMAMLHFSRLWSEAADCMSQGKAHPEITIGGKENWPELTPLLRARSELLRNFATDDGLWEA